MINTLNKIGTALSWLYGGVYFCVYTGEDPLNNHVVAVPVGVDSYEADSERFQDTDTVNVSIFTQNANIFEVAEAAVEALESAGLYIEDRSYFIDNKTKQHQYDILVKNAYLIKELN